MGRLWWAGPSIFNVMGRGPARPIKFSYDGLRPGPAHQVFRRWAAARPSPSHFPNFTARPGHVDLAGRVTGRPMCCPELRGQRTWADVFFSLYLY